VAPLFGPPSTYVDATYCYRPSSVVCLSVTVVNPAKKVEPIEMPFGLRTRVGTRRHVLDGIQIRNGNGQLTAEPIEMLFGPGLGWAQVGYTLCHLANSSEPSIYGCR